MKPGYVLTGSHWLAVEICLVNQILCLFYTLFMNYSQQNLTVYGDVYLRSLDYTNYNIWFNELALFIYIIVMLTFAYITLRSIKKHK